MAEMKISKAMIIDHYKQLAGDYDRCYKAQSRGIATFIQKIVKLDVDSQIVDIGGGTAQISLMIKEDLGMKHPVVCVDPSKEMLDVARKNGAITVESTAEEFFASKPNHPLKFILMTGCSHHFEAPDFIFSRIASLMPEDGMCILTGYPRMTTIPLFKAAKDAFYEDGDQVNNIYMNVDFESKGLNCREVSGVEAGEVDKALWYESIRRRVFSCMNRFSEEELEKGIEELDKEFRNQSVIKFDIGIKALIITKNCNLA